MVNVQLTFVALFLLVSSTVRAALPPSIINGTVTKAGVTTTYSVEPSTGAYQTISPTSYASSGSKVLSTNVGVQNGAYVRNAAIPVGETIAGIKISNSISAASLAVAAMAVAKRANALGIALTIGSALYDYLKDSGIGVDSSGTFNAPPQYLSSSTTSAACSEIGTSGGTAYYHSSINNVNYSYQVMTNTAPKGSPCAYGCSASINGYCSTSVVPATNGCSAAVCRYDNVTIPSAVPISDTSAYNKLQSSSFPDTTDADRLVKQIVDASPGMAPSYSSPANISGPSSVNQPDQTTANPDGSVSKKSASTSLNYPPGTGSVQATSHETVTTTHPDGTTTTSTYDESVTFDPIQFDDPNVIPSNSGSTGGGTTQTDCEKFPSSAGCANLGDAPAPDTLQTQTPTFSITPVSVGGSGSCPAAKTFNVSGYTYSLSLDYICQGADMLSSVILAISWMIAGYIVFGSVRSS